MVRDLGPILASHAFMREFSSEHQGLLLGCAANRVFRPGESLIREGEAAEHFFLIREGKVSVDIAPPGAGDMPIQTIGAGDVLGWSWLIPPHRWRFNAKALELTRVLSLDGACLRAKCEEDHHLGYQLLRRFSQVMVERLEATRMQLLDMYAVPD